MSEPGIFRGLLCDMIVPDDFADNPRVIFGNNSLGIARNSRCAILFDPEIEKNTLYVGEKGSPIPAGCTVVKWLLDEPVDA